MIGTIYRCEICGIESDNPVRWIVIQCNDAQLTVLKWTKEAAGRRKRGIIAARLMRRFTSAGGLSLFADEGEWLTRQVDHL